MRIRQAVKAPGFDPGKEGTLFTLVQIQHPQFWTRQVLQNGKPLVDGYTPTNNLITEKRRIINENRRIKSTGIDIGTDIFCHG